MRLNYGLRWRARKLLRSLKPPIDPRGVTIIQSADAVVAAGMLAQSARTCEAYCRRHGYSYRSYIGIRRGFHPWQACFNRVFQLRDLWDEGFRGWVFHVDADAMIVDLDFDLRWVMPLRPVALIASHSEATRETWDINTGVFLLNLGSPDGRVIMERWYSTVMDTPEEELRQSKEWGKGDQPRLHEILGQDAALTRRALHTDPILQTSDVFVKHFLRASGLNVAEREQALRHGADALLRTSAERQ